MKTSIGLLLIAMFCIPWFSPGAEAEPMSDYVHSEWWFNSQSQADREAIQNDLIWTGDYSQILDGVFGNSTFAAIKAYQTRNRFVPDGVLEQSERSKLLLDGQAARGVTNWSPVTVDNIGLNISLPLALLDPPKSENDGKTWLSKDGRFSVSVYRAKYQGGTFSGTYASFDHAPEFGNIAYRTFRPNFFIVASRVGERNLYTRAWDKGGEMAALTISWSGKPDEDIRKLVVAMSDSGVSTTRTEAQSTSGPITTMPPQVDENKIVETPLPTAQKKIQTGTGFFVSSNGDLITNAHVVEGCDSAIVRLDDSRMSPTVIVAKDTLADLALLRSTVPNPSFAVFHSGAPIRLGSDIELFGFPLLDMLTNTGNFVTGTVAALAGPGNDASLIQITAPVQSGNSGGAVLDRSGNAVAVVVSKTNTVPNEKGSEVVQSVNFAISGDVVKSFLERQHTAFVQSGSDAQLSTADIADTAKKFSAIVICEPH